MSEGLSEGAKYKTVAEVIEAVSAIIPSDTMERYLNDEPEWSMMATNLRNESLDIQMSGILGVRTLREYLVFYLRDTLTAALYMEIRYGYRVLRNGSIVNFDDEYYNFMPELMMLVYNLDDSDTDIN